MKFSIVVAALASFTGLVSASNPTGLLPLCTAPVTSRMCKFERIIPTPQHFHCQELGKVTAPSFVMGGGCYATDFESCRDFCLDIGDCFSFGYHAATKECNMFRRALINQKWVDRTADHGWVYSNTRHCYRRSCPLPAGMPELPKGTIPKGLPGLPTLAKE